MQATLEKRENNLVSLEFTAEPKEVQEALSLAYQKVVKKVSIPGFRKGKVPRRVLESHFGKEVLFEDAMEILVSRGYREALIEHGLEPIDNPKLEIVQAIEEDKPFVFKARVQVLPEVKLGNYKGLKVEKKVARITEEDVEKELKALQERHAELVVVEKDSLEKGDFAVIDFEGYVDGQAFPGGAAQGYTIEVGAGRFIPGLEDGLIGMKPGTEKEIKVTFPEDYHNKDLAGKEAVFKVKLQEIKNKELPVLDDEFAKSLGHGETLPELKEDIKKHLQEYVDQEAERDFQRQVVEKVVAESVVEIPEILINRELDHLVHDVEHDLSHRGLKLEQYLETTNQTEESLRNELRPRAEKGVKIDLVLTSIAKAEGIEATEEEINNEIEKSLVYYPENRRKEIRKRMENPNVREGMKQSLVKKKVVDFLVKVNEPVLVEDGQEEVDKVVEE